MSVKDSFELVMNQLHAELLRSGDNTFLEWLKKKYEEGKFEDAIDWLQSVDYEKLASRNEYAVGFNSLNYPWHLFYRHFENIDTQEDDENAIYKEAYEWFSIEW